MKVSEDVGSYNGLLSSSIDDVIVQLDEDITNKLLVHNDHTKKYTKRSSSSFTQSANSSASQSACTSAETSPKTNRKCGRPANPVPRHKRDSHIKAEYKRRDKIQKGFDTLKTLVPALDECSSKESKAAMLQKTAEHTRHLRAECKTRQDEAIQLRQEIQALGTQIHALQSMLPVDGAKGNELVAQEPKLDTLYNNYVTTSIKKNWKFYIFSLVVEPLFHSYKASMSEECTSSNFVSILNHWASKNLALTNLRQVLCKVLRNLSKETSILTEPHKLENEVKAKVEKNTSVDPIHVLDSCTSLSQSLDSNQPIDNPNGVDVQMSVVSTNSNWEEKERSPANTHCSGTSSPNSKGDAKEDFSKVDFQELIGERFLQSQSEHQNSSIEFPASHALSIPATTSLVVDDLHKSHPVVSPSVEPMVTTSDFIDSILEAPGGLPSGSFPMDIGTLPSIDNIMSDSLLDNLVSQEMSCSTDITGIINYTTTVAPCLENFFTTSIGVGSTVDPNFTETLPTSSSQVSMSTGQ